MSDGGRVVVYRRSDGANVYRILPPGGAWGAAVLLPGATYAIFSHFVQAGDVIYGALSACVGGGTYVTLVKLSYNAGSITRSQGAVTHQAQADANDCVVGIYWDSTNSYLHVRYGAGGSGFMRYLEAFDASLINKISLDMTSYGGNSAHGASDLAGDGSSSFFAIEPGGVFAISASGTVYTITPETGMPVLSGTLVGRWDGSSLVVLGADPTGVRTYTRTASNTYSALTTLATSDALGATIESDSRQAVVMRTGAGTNSDLAVFFNTRTAPTGYGGPLYALQRVGGGWSAPMLIAGNLTQYVSVAASDVNDTGNIPYAYVNSSASPAQLVVASAPFADAASYLPYTFGDAPNGAVSKDPVNLATGSFVSSATDLQLPGRILPFSFTRWYNSADTQLSSLGASWTHSYDWTVADAGASVEIRRGDGRRDTYTTNPDATYAPPQGVFDKLVKNADSSFTLTLSNQTQYEFSSAGVLTRIHEPAGNQIILAYTNGNLTTITDTVARQITLTYDGSSRLTQIQDPLGRKVTYAYDSAGRLSIVTDKIGNSVGQDPTLHRWQYGYDGSSRHLATITDPDGRVRVSNSYDTQGRVYQQLDGLNHQTSFAYSTGQTIVTDARSHATTYTFDSRARVLTQTDLVDANTYALSYVYDTAGNRTSVTDRNGKTTDFTYDTNGNLLTKTDPQVDPQTPRYLTQFAHDAKNNLTQIADPRNFVTTNTYDPTTNVLLSASRQIDAMTFVVTKYEYSDASNPGLPTKVIAPRGNLGGTPDYTYATTLTYDSPGNLVSRIDPDAAKTTYVYDGAGRMTSFVDPDGNVAGAVASEHMWVVGYDANDHETSRTDPLGKSIQYGFDRTGDRTSLADRDGHVTTYAYDNNKRLQTVQQKPDPIGNPTLVYTTSVTRDNNGNATRITQGNNVTTDYGFDALDRMTSMTTHPDGATNFVTTHVLDGSGNVLSKTTPDSVTVTNTYDVLNRLTSVAATGLTTTTYTYDASGNRTQMVDGTGVTTYQYDGLGRMTQAAQPNGTLGYAYDRDGNRGTLVYPGTTGGVAYTFSPGGRLIQVQDWAGRISSYTYTPSGLVSGLDYPNGARTGYTYDRAQRLTVTLTANASGTLDRQVYGLDAEGNRTTLDEYVQGISAAPTTTWSASVKVNDDTSTNAQDHPAIAIAPDGATHLVWDDARSGTTNIYFSRRDPSIGTWSANQKVNSDSNTRAHQNPAIAVDGSNNTYAVWQDSRNGTNNSPDVDIYFSKRSASTGTWGTNLRVNDDTKFSPAQRNPRIVVTSAGAATAAWVDLRSSLQNIYSSTLAAGGSGWAANIKVTDAATVSPDSPDLALGADGTVYAVWQDNRGGNADIYFSKLTPGAQAWSTNVKISDDPGTAPQRAPRIAIDGAGNLTVAWLDDRTTPSTIRVTRLLAGTSTWTPSVVVTDAAARPLSLALAVRADGKAEIEWHDNRGTSTDVYASEFDPWLNVWSVSQLISDDPGTAAQQSPTIAYTSSEFISAWRDDRSGNGDVQARRGALSGGADHFAYTYDGLNRLTGVTGPVAESFSFDAASNISSRTGPNATYTFDTSNRLTNDGSQTFTWNSADRLAARGTNTFTYDPLGRLTNSTVSGSPRTFTYNGDGLLSSSNGSPSATYLWDIAGAPGRLVSTSSDLIVYGRGPIYGVHADGTTYSLIADALGSVRAELSDSATLLRSLRYSAYGQVAASNGGQPSALGYAGELADTNGFIYLRARWYDPSSAIFVTRDSYAGVTSDPSSLNGYIYASRRPSVVTDPSGLDPSLGATNSSSVNVRAFLLPDYTRLNVVVDPFHVGWGGQLSFAIDRYGLAYAQSVGLSGSMPEAPRFSTAPIGVTATAGWIVAAGVPSAAATRAFLTGPSYSACAAYWAAVCATLSPGALGFSKFAVEAGIGTPDASFSGGYSTAISRLPIRW